MPHVDIKCYPGRSEDQKHACAEKIAEVIAETLGCGTGDVSVAIKDIPKEDWNKRVIEGEILPNEKYLYKKIQ